LYKFFQSKNPSISHQNFLPPERFFKSRTVLTLPEFEHSILYNFHVGAKQHQTQISQFQPILYNPTTKTLETVHTDNIEEYENIPDDGVIFFSEKQLFPCPRELNTKPLGDENKTVMIAIEERAEDFFLILEDSTDKNSKQYSVICHGKYAGKYDKAVLLYEKKRSLLLYGSEESLREVLELLESSSRENVEYPQDISFILKAKYMSGIQKYYFKFQYGHIKISKFYFENFFRGRAIFGAVISPLYFYHSFPIYLFAFVSYESQALAFYWHYRDLLRSRGNFQIDPLDQMFAIPDLKAPSWCQSLLRNNFFTWIIFVVVLTLFLPKQTTSREFW